MQPSSDLTDQGNRSAYGIIGFSNVYAFQLYWNFPQIRLKICLCQDVGALETYTRWIARAKRMIS